MSGLCNSVTAMAGWFLLLALVIALVETGFALWAKWNALRATPKNKAELAASTEGLDKILEALAKVLGALKDLPAWVAIFLAAMALVWTAAAAPQLCP